MAYFQARTDLALEAREYVEDANGALHGVVVEEYDVDEVEIHVTRVQITTKNGAKLLGKPMGTYVTLEVPRLTDMGESSDVGEQHREVAEEISRQLLELLPQVQECASVLVIGLGNRDVTADALGPAVIEHLCITRHMIKEYGKRAFSQENMTMVSSMAPGVMAKTGMETAEIVAGIVKETRPDAVIVIDALAARSTRRLNRTIQIRVPTVVDAATIVGDALEKMYKEVKEAAFLKARESVALTELNNMYVTAKDIDATIKRLSFTLAEALNITFGMEA